MRNRYIVIHHPADDNIQLSLRDHVRPPFTDAPYDWWVEYPTGETVKGRSLMKQGAHVIPDYPPYMDVNNRTAIGIAFEGNFDDEKPPIGPSEQQIERGAALVGALCAEYGIPPSKVYSHRQVSRTACPGRHFMEVWPTFIGKVKFYYLEALKEVIA